MWLFCCVSSVLLCCANAQTRQFHRRVWIWCTALFVCVTRYTLVYGSPFLELGLASQGVYKKRKRSPDLEDNVIDAASKPSASHDEAHYGETTTTTTTITTATQPAVSSTLDLYSSFSSQSTQSTSGSRVLATFGPKITTWTNKKTGHHKHSIGRVGPQCPPNPLYMFDLLKYVSNTRSEICAVTGIRIKNCMWPNCPSDENAMFTWNVRLRHQGKYRTWGRVCFESESKQSNPIVLLEGYKSPPWTCSKDKKYWPMVELDVSELSECCLFPGQIIAVEGLNISEDLLKVNYIYNGSFIKMAQPPQLSNDLKIIVAVGPFTPSNDLSYKPLWELMACVVEEEPDMLVLIGPFIDYNHPDVQKNTFNCSFQEFFNNLIIKIKSYVDGKHTRVFLIASNRDVHHQPIYPTPRFFMTKRVSGLNIYVMPDPCTLDIEGLRIVMTSVDSLMHIGREEVTLKPSKMDKLTRLGHHILNQACLYPLFPPAKEINIDSELWEEYVFLKEKPHLLFLPSDMRYFCKSIDECVILNPERLSKRTFAKINVKSATNGWTHENISCEIIKM